MLWSSSSAFPAPGVEAAMALPDSALRASPIATIAPGNLVSAAGVFFLPVVAGKGSAAEVRMLRFDPSSGGEPQDCGVGFRGERCGLTRLPDERLLLGTVEADPEGGARLVARRGAADARTWEDPVTVSVRSSSTVLGRSRPVATPRGETYWIAVWNEHEPDQPTDAVCLVSNDAGESWREAGSVRADGIRDASLAPLEDGQLLLALDIEGELATSISDDAGRTWSAPRALGVRALPAGIALARGELDGELALAWTDPAPDTTRALPALQALRGAISADGGSTWRHMQPMVLWPGRIPMAPSVWLDRNQLLAVFVDVPVPWEAVRGERLACMQFERAPLETQTLYELASARFGVDPEAARTALRVLCAHTLARPPGPRRLFVEGYFMRSLVAAHPLLQPKAGEAADGYDARAGLARAIDWADELIATQDTLGYWPTGYGAVFLADMAAALGLFPALEPHVAVARVERFETAARRFADALVEDEMLLASGACGVGWWGTTLPRLRSRALREPYLVSTALAGIELHAWLYRRSGREEDRQRALRALEFTLSQIQPDGSFHPGPKVPGIGTEGRFTTAAYVHEGWMAADVLLGEPAVLEQLRAALRPHVDWLLREQLPDGRWDSGATGEFARTPAIVDFLVWYDERCESRAEVRAAVRRAGLLLVDPTQWEATGLFRAGSHHEVQRALSGRSLVALASQRFAL